MLWLGADPGCLREAAVVQVDPHVVAVIPAQLLQSPLKRSEAVSCIEIVLGCSRSARSNRSGAIEGRPLSA